MPFGRPLFTDPFLHEGVFGPANLFGDAHSLFEMPSLLGGMGFGGSLMTRPVIPSDGNARFSYSCASWTSSGSLNGRHMEHNVSANGSSEGGHHLRESVTDRRTGQTHVLRQVTDLLATLYHQDRLDHGIHGSSRLPSAPLFADS